MSNLNDAGIEPPEDVKARLEKIEFQPSPNRQGSTLALGPLRLAPAP